MVSTVWSTDFTDQRQNKTTRQTYLIRRFFALVILISVLTTSAYAVSAFTSSGTSAEQGSSFSETHQTLNRVIVESGMSLWTIASEYKPADVSTRAYVNYLMKINDLDSPTIQLGDVILVP